MIVRFEIDDDARAIQAHLILESLGLKPVRVLDDDARRVAWAVEVIGAGARLTERESSLLTELLTGTPEDDLAGHLGIPSAAVPMFLGSLIAKTGSTSTADLLARARATWDGSREAETRALAKRWGEALHGTGADDARARALAAVDEDVVAAIGRVVDAVDGLVGVPQLQSDLDALCRLLHGALGVPVGTRRRGGR